MERAVKEENIAALKGDLAKATSLVLADFRGINVKNDTALRREFRLNGCKYQVVKNTLLGRAVEGTAMAGLEKLFVGPVATSSSTTSTLPNAGFILSANQVPCRRPPFYVSGV